MDFRGHLRLPEDAGTGIPVLLRLDDIFVVISSGVDELGTWRADDVAIERIFSNQFAIELDGESMVFLAQDALGFAYDGISAIEDLQERLTKRRVFKRTKKKLKPVETPAESQPADSEPAAAVTPQPVSAGRAAVETPDAPAAPSEEELVDEPVLAGETKAIWTPPSASQPASQPHAATEPDIEVAVPDPVQRRVGAEPPVPPAADLRVSYPQPSTPPPPAAESFVPPAEDDVSVSPPVEESPIEVPPPSPAADAPTADEPEFEIEEVSAASTGGTWADDATVEIESDEPEIEIEIEEYVLPSAGAVDIFTAPAPDADDDVEPAPAEIPEQQTEAERDVSSPESPRPGREGYAAEGEDLVEGRHLAEDTEEPATDAPAEEARASNGHTKSHVSPKSDDSQDSNRRERRHSLFGRSRDKKAPPHEHQYGEPKTIGGLKRQVCDICAHVTFSGEDVYQGW
ncbi:MAG: hypothetical protein WD990_07535 [Acidimicrobiia bacterium]